MKIACISDTHEQHEALDIWFMDNIDSIDMIIHAGDGANSIIPEINESKLRDFLHWLNSWKTPVVYVPGNHDTSFEKGLINKDEFGNITFLVHELKEVNGIKIFGSPYTPKFGMEGWAYNVKRQKLDKYWEAIPDDTQILVTHGPPKYILDLTEDYNVNGMVNVGCKALLNHVRRVEPKYHIFGHIHDEKLAINNGIRKLNDLNTIFINASIVNLMHTQKNVPIIIEV